MSTNAQQDHIAWKGEWQTPVPDGLLHSDMSGMAKLLWICLKSFASKTSPNPFPGRHTVCKMMGLGVGAFKKYRRELENKGWLERQDRRSGNGFYGGSLFTLMVAQNCKQKYPRGVENRPPANRAPVNGATDNRPTKEYQDLKETRSERNTTTEGAVCGNSASQPGATPPGPHLNGKTKDGAQGFVKRWEMCFQKRFGIPYRTTPSELTAVETVFKNYEKIRTRDMVYTALQMWEDTRDKEGVQESSRDPLFYNFKGQRNLGFFCRHLERIVEEQDDTMENLVGRVTAKEVDVLEEMLTPG